MERNNTYEDHNGHNVIIFIMGSFGIYPSKGRIICFARSVQVHN